jgi:hypothetical protein
LVITGSYRRARIPTAGQATSSGWVVVRVDPPRSNASDHVEPSVRVCSLWRGFAGWVFRREPRRQWDEACGARERGEISRPAKRGSVPSQDTRSQAGKRLKPTHRTDRKGRRASEQTEKYRFAQNVGGAGTMAERVYEEYALSTRDDPRGDPDLFLDVPVVKVDSTHLEVEVLDARVALQANILDLVNIQVGVHVQVSKVRLDIEGVEVQFLLKGRLDHVAAIIDRVLTTLDRNPDIVRSLGRTVEEVGRGAGHLAAKTGKALEHVGSGVESALGDIGSGAGRAVGQLEETRPAPGGVGAGRHRGGRQGADRGRHSSGHRDSAQRPRDGRARRRAAQAVKRRESRLA